MRKLLGTHRGHPRDRRGHGPAATAGLAEDPPYTTTAASSYPSRDGSKIVIAARNAYDLDSVSAVAEKMYCS
jgi:hypothetical protein